jgi:hypothetical protein
MDAIKTLFAEKEVSSEKRKRRDKEEAVKGYIDI